MGTKSDLREISPGPRIHARLLRPFLWAYGERPSAGFPALGVLLRDEGVELGECVRPDGLVSLSCATQALARYVRVSGDSTVGLRVGFQIEPGDLHVVEDVARSSSDLGSGLACAARYMPLLNEAAVVEQSEEGEAVLWRWLGRDGADVPEAEDFAIACAIRVVERYAGAGGRPREAHWTRRPPGDPGLYERVLQTTVRFAMPRAALVFDRAQMALPLGRASEELHCAFDACARDLLDRRPTGLRGHIVELATRELSKGRLTMEALAREVGASSATLRRRLDREGTSFRSIVRELRRTLAERHLLDRRLTISEIAFAVGFSNVRAFHKAFRRWNGVSPSAYRARAQAQVSAPEGGPGGVASSSG